ncbi:MAG: hypothetical protein HUK16_00130 [Bacteroidales bacterium]|nr:hypothetical protein [Bacteroidales bacterium]
MFKKIKNKALRCVLSVFTCILGVMLALFLVLYLSAPRYQFIEPKPFSGKYLHNPYQGMNPDNWKRYNFHCHSRQYRGLTNGRSNTEYVIDSIYAIMDYDHAGISDYMFINPHACEKEGYIPAFEHGYGLFRKTHQLCIGAEDVWKIDYPFMQSLDLKQHTINKLSEKCRFVVPAHPSFTKGYKVQEMKYLSNYKLLEILNPYGDGIAHWDMALSNGHLVYGIADDDSHNVLDPNEVGRFFTVINTASLAPDSVFAALEKGCSYAVNFNPFYNEPFQDKVDGLKRLPHLTRIELVGDTLIIEASTPIWQVHFYGQDGTLLASEDKPSPASYVIRPEDTYVRAVLEVAPGYTFVYLNPITRHEMPVPVEKRLDRVNVTQSVMMWVVYIVAAVFSLYAIIKKRKESKQQSHENQGEQHQ